MGKTPASRVVHPKKRGQDQPASHAGLHSPKPRPLAGQVAFEAFLADASRVCRTLTPTEQTRSCAAVSREDQTEHLLVAAAAHSASLC